MMRLQITKHTSNNDQTLDHPKHQLSITSGLCKHHTMLEVANLIAVVGGDATAHEVRQRARCHNCGVKGNNTYQIVYTGNSSMAMDGASTQPALSQSKSLDTH
jgi:NAD kinase